MSFQLRGQDAKGRDTGELVELPSLEEAFAKFLAGGFWKLSWAQPDGKRVRLVREGDTIQITDIMNEIPDVMQSMTEKARKKHIETAGMECCPFCNAENDPDEILECSELDTVEDGSIEQTVKCLECGRSWMDIFRLVDVTELA